MTNQYPMNDDPAGDAAAAATAAGRSNGSVSTAVPSVPSVAGVSGVPGADGAWPIAVTTYSPAADKRGNLRFLGVTAAVTVVTGLIGALLLQSRWLFGFAYFVFTITIVAAFMSMYSFYKVIHQLKVSNKPGYLITGKAILDAYARHGVREVSLTTPTIYEDSDDPEWDLTRNDVPGLWFQPTTQTHTYVLYWRDDAYRDLSKRVGRSVDEYGYSALGTTFAKETHTIMEKFRTEHGVDLRMWPCVLEVNGTKARLMFDPNAQRLERGVQDPNIRAGADKSVFMLADTF